MPAPDYVAQRTVDPEKAPDKPEIITIGFEKGDAVSVNGEKLSPAALLTKLNELGGKHGIGRLDLVENRFVGMKSRGALRDARRHDPARGASRHRVHHARPRRGASQG